jgi:hypothetical protein
MFFLADGVVFKPSKVITLSANTIGDQKMIGYKGFNQDWTCRDKQYKVGETFEETDMSLCEIGMHFCENPLDAFAYYSPAASKFALVEAENVSDQKDNDSKRVCRKLTIKKELSITEIIELSVKFSFSKDEKNKKVKFASGEHGAASASGEYGAASASGSYGAASTSGEHGAASAYGEHGAAIASGDNGAASASGWCGAASASGEHGAAIASGEHGSASASGKNGIAAVFGSNGKAKAAKNNWIVLTEKDVNRNIICVKSVKIDGKKYKENVFYTLKNGKIIEAK